MDMPLHKHVENMITLARTTFSQSGTLGKEIGTTNAKGDQTIEMDAKIEKIMIEYIQNSGIPADIFSEEIGVVQFHPHPEYLIAFDPLDGSTNYKLGRNLLPYGFLVAIYKGLEPKLYDVIVAGALEHTQGLAWVYKEGKTYQLDGNEAHIKHDWIINKSTPVYLDLYYKEGYEGYRPLAQQIFIRNLGSTIGNLSHVLSGVAGGLGGICMRPEEIGAIVSLIKGAGGIVVDHNGITLDNLIFSPKSVYQILAGDEKVIQTIISLL